MREESETAESKVSARGRQYDSSDGSANISTVTYRVVGSEEAATVSLGLSQQVEAALPQQPEVAESSAMVEIVDESLFTQQVSTGSVGMLTLQHERSEEATDFEVRHEFVLTASLLGLVVCFLQHEGIERRTDSAALSPSSVSRSTVSHSLEVFAPIPALIESAI